MAIGALIDNLDGALVPFLEAFLQSQQEQRLASGQVCIAKGYIAHRAGVPAHQTGATGFDRLLKFSCTHKVTA
jgi:hypothetical protein